jgi:hypothetical protein
MSDRVALGDRAPPPRSGASTTAAAEVREHRYDSEQVQWLAFGTGIERIAMLKHGSPT